MRSWKRGRAKETFGMSKQAEGASKTREKKSLDDVAECVPRPNSAPWLEQAGGRAGMTSLLEIEIIWQLLQ